MRFTAIGMAVCALMLLMAACPRADNGNPNKVAVTASEQLTEAAQYPGSGGLAPPPGLTPAGAQFQWLITDDGWSVASWFYSPKSSPAPGVILVHMRGQDKASWRELAGRLVAEGYAVLALDLRGHGETLNPAGQRAKLSSLGESDYQAMLADIRAAHVFFEASPEVDADRVAILGASIGADLAIIYAANERRVRTVVALSPGLDYYGLKPAGYLDAYGTRALYLLASQQDEYAYQSCLELERLAVKANPVSFREFEGQAHGTDLFQVYDGLADTIASGWLLNHLPPR